MNENKQDKLGYKHTPLGWIPEEWEIKDFVDVTSKILDGTHFSPKSKNGHFRYITSKNIRNEGLDLTNLTFIDEKEHKEIYKRCAVVFDDILLTKDGAGTGTCCKNILHEEFSLLSSVAVLRSNEIICHNDFLYHYIKGPRGQFVIKDAIAGQAITRITLEKIRYFDIILPVVPEQRKIATILSTWDEAITKTQQLIARLQQRNKGLMQQLLSGKKRLRAFENEEWKKLHATEIFKGISVKNNGTERLLSASQDRGIIPRDMLEARVTMPSGETGSFKLVDVGDFVISLRSFQGGIEYSDYKGLVSPVYTVLKPTKEISTSFFRHYFKSYDFIGHLAVAVIGIRDGKQVSYEDFSILKLPYPSIEEQEAIAKVLDAAVAEVRLQEKRLATLQQQKKGLMQKLLTGEIRVKLK